MLTLKEILALPVMQGSIVLAGAGGLNNETNGVTVMEVPDIVPWLKENDILITSMYALKDDIGQQESLVASLARGSCACLFVKLGQYVRELAPSVLAEAEKCNFPIVQIPYNTYYTDIILAVGEVIYGRRNLDELVEKYVKDILFGVKNRYLREAAHLLGGRLDRDNNFFTLTVRLDMEPELLKNIARKIAAEIKRRTAVEYYSVISLNDTATILFADLEKTRLEERLSSLRREAEELAAYHFGGQDYRLGFGTVESGPEAIRRSYFNAVAAIETGLVFKPQARAFRYEEMEFYSILNDIMEGYAYELSENVFGKVDNKEIVDTLIAYFDNDANVKQTSTKLFVHENTIKYRLQRLRELTGLDPKNQEDSFKLYLAVLARKIQYAKKGEKNEK